MPVVGSYSSDQQISSDMPIRDMGDLSLIEPNDAPFVSLLQNVPVKKTATTTKIEWKEDDFPARITTVTTLVAAAATSVIVTDASIFVAGDIVMVMPANTSGTAPERFQISSINYGTNTLTVRRYLGGVATGATIPANTPVMQVANAAEEGSGLNAEIRTVPVNKFNYTQIFKATASWTRTAASVNAHGQPGGARAYDSRKAMIRHKRDMNRALYFGVPSEGLTIGPLGKPVRTSGGLMSTISTNNIDVGGTLTLANFLNYMDTAFRFGSNKMKFAFCGPIFLNAINNWSMNKMLVQPDRTLFGMNVTRVVTTYGELMVVLDRTLENSGNFGFANNVFIVDTEQVGQRFLTGNGYTGETRVIEDAVMTGVDGRSDYILTECAWEIKQEKYHSRLFNLTGYTPI
jgi:hypothetical protein